MKIAPSAIVELNRAVAVSMGDGSEKGLELVDAILDRGELREYHPAYAARGELLQRLGRNREAAAAFTRALELAEAEPERRHYRLRLAAIERR
jgi:RNA polymerase sigma-70 factor (ECF subfamily)